MEKKVKTSPDDSTDGLLIFMYRNKGILLTVTLAALIISVVVSLLITPLYRSTVVLYPTTSVTLSSLIRGSSMSFGEEADTERLLQVLQSESVRNRIINTYNLMEHYGVDSTSRFPQTTLHNKFRKNVRFRKTPLRAVEIEVLDTDPVIAAAIANDIAHHLDSVMNNMLRRRSLQQLAITEIEYLRMRQDYAILQDSLSRIRSMGVLDYSTQSEVFNEAFAQAVLDRDIESMDIFSDRLNTLAVYGGPYIILNLEMHVLNHRLGRMKENLDETKINTEQFIPYKFIVDEAREAEKKAYPMRSLIVAVSTLSAFVLTLFSLLLIDAFRRRVLVHVK
jgi:LPS O-antigen subunit length determinant protein (WzzB/FepE family)